ncbi:MAG: hypothetical protein ACI846_000097 [Pseudoalteromonas distincta]|jgi:hypothetical protein
MDKLGAMVMHYPNIKHLSPPINIVSFLELDLDSAAERLQVFNRKDGKMISHRKIHGSRLGIFLPVSYSSESTLMCVMLDDNNEFNAAIIDNVQPIAVDLISFDPNNPLPYEPPVA